MQEAVGVAGIRVPAAAEPTPYTAIIHEAALRMESGGSAVAKAQLRHILEMSEREHVTVLVIPLKAGAFPGAGQTFGYACGPVQGLDMVQVDASHGSEVLYAEAQLEKYRGLLKRMSEIVLDEPGSRDLIRGIMNDL